MSKPIVAVVGRPNVGKSTLFNKLCGQRLAIVEDTPGITRDRIFANCEWSGHEFMLVDIASLIKLSRCLGVSLYSLTVMFPMVVSRRTSVSFPVSILVVFF